MATARKTLDSDAGVRTSFSPPPASMARLAVRDSDGRTLFDVYEPRYHAEPAERRVQRREADPRPQTLLDILEQKPLVTLAVLFAVVLATSATVTALVQR